MKFLEGFKLYRRFQEIYILHIWLKRKTLEKYFNKTNKKNNLITVLVDA